MKSLLIPITFFMAVCLLPKIEGKEIKLEGFEPSAGDKLILGWENPPNNNYWGIKKIWSLSSLPAMRAFFLQKNKYNKINRF